MGATAGRTIVVRWGTGSPPPAVAGLREKTLTLSGEPIDVTNDDDLGWRKLIDAAQVNSAEISASGVLVNDALRADWINGAGIGSGSRMKTLQLEYYELGILVGTLAGTFYLQDYSDTGNHDGEATFEATWLNSGPFTYTPA